MDGKIRNLEIRNKSEFKFIYREIFVKNPIFIKIKNQNQKYFHQNQSFLVTTMFSYLKNTIYKDNELFNMDSDFNLNDNGSVLEV